MYCNMKLLYLHVTNLIYFKPIAGRSCRLRQLFGLMQLKELVFISFVSCFFYFNTFLQLPKDPIKQHIYLVYSRIFNCPLQINITCFPLPIINQ